MRRDEHGEPEDEVAVSLVDSVGTATAEIAAEYAELGLDSLIESEALKAIPVVASLLNMTKAIGGVRDWLFKRKVLRFLGSAAATPEAHAKFALEYSDRKARRRVGEALLLLLDKADDMIKADMLGRLFARFVMAEIDEAIMMEAARRLSAIEIEDLHRLKGAGSVIGLDEDVRWRLSNAGIVRGLRDEGAEYSAMTWRGSSPTELGRLLLAVLDNRG